MPGYAEHHPQFSCSLQTNQNQPKGHSINTQEPIKTSCGDFPLLLKKELTALLWLRGTICSLPIGRPLIPLLDAFHYLSTTNNKETHHTFMASSTICSLPIGWPLMPFSGTFHDLFTTCFRHHSLPFPDMLNKGTTKEPALVFVAFLSPAVSRSADPHQG